MKKILFATSFFPLSLLALAAAFFLLSYELTSKVKVATTRIENTFDEPVDGAITDMFTQAGDANRSEAVRQFLARYHSPLEQYANYIVEVSNTYGIDPRLIPAIAMQESNLCKKAPENSYNCWGYGIYAGKVRRFSNFKEGIETVAFSLSQDYVRKGFSTIEQIMSRYTPANTNNWVASVTHFMSQMEQ